MDQRTITIIVIFFVVLVAGMFGFAYLKKAEIIEDEPATTVEPTAPEVVYPLVERIDGKHYFIDGVHTVVGEIVMPTPCDLLEADAVVVESFPEQITLQFNVINNADTCVQVLTPQRFKVSTEASPEATFSARFIDRVVPLNLIPAADGETPEEFELFTKG